MAATKEKMVKVIVVKQKGLVKRSVLNAEGVKVPIVYGPGDVFEVPESELNRLGTHGSIVTVEDDDKRKQAQFDRKKSDLDQLRAELMKTAPATPKAEAKDAK
jgi:hypothetical protein